MRSATASIMADGNRSYKKILAAVLLVADRAVSAAPLVLHVEAPRVQELAAAIMKIIAALLTAVLWVLVSGAFPRVARLCSCRQSCGCNRGSSGAHDTCTTL